MMSLTPTARPKAGSFSSPREPTFEVAGLAQSFESPRLLDERVDESLAGLEGGLHSLQHVLIDWSGVRSWSMPRS